MKILMLAQTSMPLPSPKDKIFAPGIIFTNIAIGLNKRGHDVTVMAASDSKVKTKLLDYKIPSSYSLNLMDASDRTYRSAQHQMYLTSEAIKEFKVGEYDLLHLDEFRVAPYFSEFVDGSVTCTYHGIPAKDHDLKFDLDILRQKKFYDKINFIAVADKQRELGSEYFKFAGRVHHGVDTLKFKFSKRGGDRLAFVGRLVEGKNPDIAIEIAKNSNYSIDLYGDYDEENEYYKSKIEPQIGEDVGVKGHIHFLKMSNVYQNAKALLFPITWDEAFGLVVIEAMACGTPVIAFDRGAMKELIVDGVTGFVVKEGDIKAMIEAVKNIDKIDRQKCREHVEKNFSLEKMVSGYEDVFKNIINKSK